MLINNTSSDEIEIAKYYTQCLRHAYVKNKKNFSKDLAGR